MAYRPEKLKRKKQKKTQTRNASNGKCRYLHYGEIRIELPSGEIRVIDIEPEQSYKDIADTLGLNVDNVAFFIRGSKKEILGELLSPQRPTQQFPRGYYGDIIIVDKTNPKPEYLELYNKLMKKQGGSYSRLTRKIRRI